MATAKLFKSGGSQAVRLPKQFRFPGNEVQVKRAARGGVLLEPILSGAEKKRLFAELGGSEPEFPLPEPQPSVRATRRRRQRRA